jgi:hypothetical protein
MIDPYPTRVPKPVGARRGVFFLCLLALAARAFSVEYRVSFDGVLDNMEYGAPSSALVDRTIFLSRTEGEAGILLGGGHGIRGGLSFTQEFGAQESPDNLHLLLYYRYEGEEARFRFGAFPRAGALDLPEWFFGSEAACVRPFVHGAVVEAARWGIAAAAWVDWIGRQSAVVNESFLFGYGLKYARGPFFLRHDFMMYHLAGTDPPAPGSHVRDNGGASAEAGAAFGRAACFDTLSISAGAIASIDRDRGDGLWHMPKGGFVSGFAGSGFLALRGFYYAGEPQRLMWGGDFYNFSDIGTFGRVDLMARFAKKENVRAELYQSLHFYDGRVGYSQHFLLHAELSSKTRKKKGFGIKVTWD